MIYKVAYLILRNNYFFLTNLRKLCILIFIIRILYYGQKKLFAIFHIKSLFRG